MTSYKAIIYFRDGNKVESGLFSGGTGAQMQAERWASTEFDRYMCHAISKHFEPTRYEIKEVER